MSRDHVRWSHKEDVLLQNLRGEDLSWEEISAQLPGRGAQTCHTRAYKLDRQPWTDGDLKRLGISYQRHRREMWSLVANELGVSWASAERVYMQLGRAEMMRRARETPKKVRELRPATATQDPGSKSPEQVARTHPAQESHMHQQPIVSTSPIERHQRKESQGGLSSAGGNVQSLPSIRDLDLGISTWQTGHAHGRLG